MVKPARLGSSVGMTLVHDPSELDAALDEAFRHDTLALVETYVAGARDLEVAIIGNDPGDLELYGPGEIVSGHEFYDYAAKYTAGPVRRPRPGPRSPTASARPSTRSRATPTGRSARKGSRASTSCWPARRSSCRRSTRSRDFTPISLFPTMPAEGGYTFGAVCSRIVELAIERHAARAGRRLSPADLPR